MATILYAPAAATAMRAAAPAAVLDVRDKGPQRVSLTMLSLPAASRRSGQGSAAMAALTAYADAHSLTVTLTPDSSLGTPLAVLHRFYRAYGFHPVRNPEWLDTWTRYPVQ